MKKIVLILIIAMCTTLTLGCKKDSTNYIDINKNSKEGNNEIFT